MRELEYKLAVQGRKNFTPIGRTYPKLLDALGDADRVNDQRKRDGLKPAVAIKRYAGARGWVFVRFIED